MKYTTQIQIDKPIDTCFALIENIDHLKHWQSGLHSVEHISGTPRQVGAILQLNYLFDRQYLTLTETLNRAKIKKLRIKKKTKPYILTLILKAYIIFKKIILKQPIVIQLFGLVITNLFQLVYLQD